VAAWRNATDVDVPPPTATTAGVLRPDELARFAALDRAPAGEQVQRWVENHWSVCWDLPADRHHVSQVLPHPTCSLTVELAEHPRPGLPAGETLVVTGVATRRFDVELRGAGRVLGVRFRPGGLAALTGRDASAWTDRTVPARDVLPPHLCAELADPQLAAAPREWTAAAEAAIASIGRDREDPRYDELIGVITDMLADRSLVTVQDVARRHGIAPRSLQRLFRHYVGVGPKWVLARYRIHDIVSELDEGYSGTITDLAHRYGWYDQAHLTRDFTSLIGTTPTEYRDRSSDRPGSSELPSGRSRD
jgi:AraC-like DNA-binding protein